MEIEDVRKYLKNVIDVSWKKLQEESNKPTINTQKKMVPEKVVRIQYLQGRFDSYNDLYCMILGKEEERKHLKLDC